MYLDRRDGWLVRLTPLETGPDSPYSGALKSSLLSIYSAPSFQCGPDYRISAEVFMNYLFLQSKEEKERKAFQS